MPSLEELLKKHGIEAEASKLEALKKDHFAEYKTVSEVEKMQAGHEKAIKALEDDKAAITKERDQLKTTSENLKVDGMTPEDVKKLKADFEARSKQTKDREEADKKKAAASEFEKAFDTALGERKFSNSLIRDSVPEFLQTNAKVMIYYQIATATIPR